MIAPYFFCTISPLDLNNQSKLKQIEDSINVGPSLRAIGRISKEWIFCLYPRKQIIEQTVDHITIGLGQYQRRDSPWAIVLIDFNARSIRIESDELGMLPFFIDKNMTRISTEHFEITKYCTNRDINHHAITDFILWGQTFDNETFFQDLSLLPEKSLIEKSSNDLKFKSQAIQYNQTNNGTIIENYHKSLSGLIRNLGPKYMTLTGGSDSRMNLYLLTQEQRDQLIFWFDTDNPSSSEELKSELAAIYPLVDRFKLKLVFGNPEPRLDENENIHHRFLDTDVHQNSITGIFGTEFLSGAFLNRYFHYGPLSYDLRTILKDTLDDKDFNRYLSRLDSINDFYAHYDSQSSDARIKEMLSAQRSFVTDLYQNAVWIHPWLQTHRKPTPFLSFNLIQSLSTLSLDEIKYYKVSIKILKDLDSTSLMTPMYSTMNYNLENPIWPIDHDTFQCDNTNHNKEKLNYKIQKPQLTKAHDALIDFLIQRVDKSLAEQLHWRRIVIEHVLQI